MPFSEVERPDAGAFGFLFLPKCLVVRLKDTAVFATVNDDEKMDFFEDRFHA